MTLRQKLDELNKDIQDTIVVDDNKFTYHPLQDKISRLAEYLKVTEIANESFKEYIKATTTTHVNKSIKLCNGKIPDNTSDIKYYKKMVTTNIKLSVDNAVWWFKKGSTDLEIDNLDKPVT